MAFTNVNFVGVVISAVVAMVLGFIWYIPLFGKQWTALTGMTQEQMQSGAGPMGYAIQFVAAVIAAYALALFIRPLEIVSLFGGLKLGLLVGVGFVATAFAGNYMFGKRSLNLYLIDAGYQVVVLAVMGAILGLMH